MTRPDLHLHEEILLLALDDDEGTIDFGSSWQMAAGGALIAELLLEGRLRATDDKHPKLLVVDPTPLGDAVLDAVLEEIASAKKPKKGSDWVQKFANQGKLKERIAEGLVGKGVLKVEQDKVLWIFDRTKYPERDGRAEKEVAERLRKAIFTTTHDLTPRTIVLVSLADVAGLLPNLFDKHRLKDRKDRIKKISEGAVAGSLTGAAMEAVQAMQAAVMVCCIMPAIVVTTTS